MDERSISIAEAAEDFDRFMAQVEARREGTVLLRAGRPVALITPITSESEDPEEDVRQWEKRDRLPPEEAEAFARDLEEIHAQLSR